MARKRSSLTSPAKRFARDAGLEFHPVFAVFGDEADAIAGVFFGGWSSVAEFSVRAGLLGSAGITAEVVESLAGLGKP